MPGFFGKSNPVVTSDFFRQVFEIAWEGWATLAAKSSCILVAAGCANEAVEEIVTITGANMLGDLGLHQAVRRSPAMQCGVLHAALGIGVKHCSLQHAGWILVRSLPYPEPERVGALVIHEQNAHASEEDDSRQRCLGCGPPESGVIIVCWKRFGDTNGANLQVDKTNGGAVRYVRSAFGVAHYFDVIGIQPLWERLQKTRTEGGSKSVVLSYSIWQSIFPVIAGFWATRFSERRAYAVAGVLPQNAVMPNPAMCGSAVSLVIRKGCAPVNNCLILMRLLRNDVAAGADTTGA